MVRLPGGRFRMGSEDSDVNPLDGEGPVRGVEISPLSIGSVPVTNTRFAKFVKSTGYVTDAERFNWSFVFHLLLTDKCTAVAPPPAQAPWWIPVSGACWRSPEGPGSGIGRRPHHPVVHVSWHDAQAYAAWSGTRLPSEAEWEYAARGGLDQARYPWGDELTPGGRHRCNIWQGAFPTHNSEEDGHLATAPVRSYPPNGFGLYEVSGNVWEWCADPFSEQSDENRVMRGGSYLCHVSYCNRYRLAARTSNSADSSAGNIGFRVAS